MSDTHNKLQYGNDYNHRKTLDLVLDINYISFSNPNTLSRLDKYFDHHLEKSTIPPDKRPSNDNGLHVNKPQFSRVDIKKRLIMALAGTSEHKYQ